MPMDSPSHSDYAPQKRKRYALLFLTTKSLLIVSGPHLAPRTVRMNHLRLDGGPGRRLNLPKTLLNLKMPQT